MGNDPSQDSNLISQTVIFRSAKNKSVSQLKPADAKDLHFQTNSRSREIIKLNTLFKGKIEILPNLIWRIMHPSEPIPKPDQYKGTIKNVMSLLPSETKIYES